MNFVKSTSTQSSDSLYFNVLKLENFSEHTLVLTPKVIVPQGFNLLSRIPPKVRLQPGKTKHIPFRISISKTAYSDINYNIQAKILSELKEQIAQASCEVHIRPRRDWNFKIDDSEMIFSGTRNTSSAFSFHLLNLGNVKEKIHINIQIPEGFKPANSNRKKDFNVALSPGVDTTIFYKVVQKYKNQELNFSDNIKIQAYNDIYHINKSIRISSYSNVFEYSPLKGQYQSYIEYSRRSIDGLREIKDELRTKGIVPLKNDNKLLYSFTNYDLSNTDEFWERSYYQLVFEGKNFSGGIGQHYSNLLVDAYNPHGAFAKWKFSTSKKSEFELYASQGLDYNITSVAAGNQLIIDKILIKTSAGYNEDSRRKQNSKSGILSASLPITKNHKLNLNTRAIERDYFKDSTYTQSGIQGNWSYFGRITPRLFMNVKNRFQTKGFYTGNQANNQFDAIFKYRLSQKNRLLIDYSYQSKTGGSSDYEIKNHRVKSALDFKTHRNQNIRTGLWLEEYTNSETSLHSESKSCNIWMETSSRGDNIAYTISAVAGYRFQENTGFDSGKEIAFKNKSPNITLESTLNIAPFGVRCSYINGSQKSSSLSQRFNYNEFRISPTYRKEILRDKMLFDLQADYQLDWVNNRKSINIRPKVSWKLKNNWTLLADAYISAYSERKVSFSGNDINSNFRISLHKDFNIGRKRKKEKFHKMKMVFFRDDNKNGLHDKKEKGIEKSLIDINKNRDDKEEKYIQLSKLVSQSDGEISYNNLPEGTYDLAVNQLASTEGYFNFSGNKMQIKLDKDTTCFIPYIKAYKIQGKLALKKTSISSAKVGQVSNIKVSATDTHGNTFSCLTNRSGYYQLPVAGKDNYVVSIHNPYGSRIKVNNNLAKVDFSDKESETVNFEFVEKRRRVNMKRAHKRTANKKYSSINPNKAKTALNKNRNTTTKKTKRAVSKNAKPTKPAKPKIINNKQKRAKLQAPRNDLFYWTFHYFNSKLQKTEDYSVYGAFVYLSNANNFASELRTKQIPAILLFNEKKKLYYVCIHKKPVN